jgi:peptidoglycan hydrolase-like protein with peptidoglycan-binding domain
MSLETLQTDASLEDLTPEQVTELQKRLTALGFNPGDIDGQMGNHTAKAWEDFVVSKQLGSPEKIGPDSVKALFAVKEAPALTNLQADVFLTDLTPAQVKELQAGLELHGFDAGGVDGFMGERTAKPGRILRVPGT